MARFPSLPSISFTRQPTSGTQTIDALMRRQRELAALQAEQATSAYPGMGTVAGGLGHMLDRFTTGMQSRRTQDEEASARAQLAQAMAGVNMDTGDVSPEALQTMMSRDPDTGMAFMQNMIESRRAARAAALAAQQRTEERGWDVEDREDAQAAAQALAEGKVEQWEDIPATEGAPPGQRFQRNAKTGEVKAIGGSGVTIQNLPAEVGARIGMGDEFLSNYDDILATVSGGGATGPIDWATAAIAGRGPGGEAYRKIQSGVDALRRGLTGAGMSMQESGEYAGRYMPTWKDDAATAASKLEGLKADLEAVRRGATVGRNAPAMPESAPATPEAVPDGSVPEIAPEDMDGYRALPPGAKYKVPGDPTIYTKGTAQ